MEDVNDFLVVKDLVKIYGQEPNTTSVLRGVEFQIKRGSFVCIMGPSGSGKSTLLHMISGLDEPSGGSIQLAGQELSQLSLKERTLLRRKTVGYVFQFFNLIPTLTVAENIELTIRLASQDGPRSVAAQSCSEKSSAS